MSSADSLGVIRTLLSPFLDKSLHIPEYIYLGMSLIEDDLDMWLPLQVLWGVWLARLQTSRSRTGLHSSGCSETSTEQHHIHVISEAIILGGKGWASRTTDAASAPACMHIELHHNQAVHDAIGIGEKRHLIISP